MKKYGIRIKLDENNPMRAPHLLGEDWVSHRWYDNEERRDAMFEQMNRQLSIYRKGDSPAEVLTKIEEY